MNKQRMTRKHQPVPYAECGSRGRMTEDDFGYTVLCGNPHCEGVMPLAENMATPTKRGAWELWAYLNKPIERKEAA